MGWKRAIKSYLNGMGLEVHRVREDGKFPDYVVEELKTLEASLNGTATRNSVFTKLRGLSLSDFGLLLLSMPNPDFPKLSALLPRMAKEEVQISWTGSAGTGLLTQTLDFVRSLSGNFARFTGRPLGDIDILDFGCGYGRITRLMYYFSGEDRVYAVDPWDRSIEICHADGLTRNFFQTDYLPSTLPVPVPSFDLIFSFSVFTHLSERATLTCLNTLASYVKPDGMIAITIRPIEYWNTDPNANKLGLIDQQKAKHKQTGFAFLPHDLPAVDGDLTYGDTSIRLDWLQARFPNLKIVGLDRSLSDPHQIYVFLQKRSMV